MYTIRLIKRCTKNTGGTFPAVMAGFLVFHGLAAFLTSVLPGFVLYELLASQGMGRIVPVLIACAFVQTAAVYLERTLSARLFKSRLCDIAAVQKAGLNIPVSELKAGDGEERMEYAMQAVCSGNDYGTEAYLNGVIGALSVIVTFAIYLALLGRLPLAVMWLALLGCVLRIPVEILVRKKENRDVEANSDDRIAIDGLRRTLLGDAFAKDVRLYDAVPLAGERLREKTLPLTAYAKRKAGRMLTVSGAGALISVLTGCLFFVWYLHTGYDVMSAGLVVVWLGVLTGIGGIVSDMADCLGTVSANREAVERFFSFLSRHEQGDVQDAAPGGTQSVPQGDVCLKAENLSFSYDDHPVIRKASFDIRKGETLAVVGRNGVGKSTLINLMLGILRPQEGALLYEGRPVCDMDQDSYWEHVSVALQEAPMLPFTLSENISSLPAGSEDVKRLNAVCEDADLLSRVQKLKDGYATYCGSAYTGEGVSFSGGEQQKIFMARMLYKDAELVFLDEPTAALDAKAEAEIYGLYQRAMRGKTCIFVSHRLSSVRFCDRILFFEDADHLTTDTFDNLYKENALFREMYDTQKTAYEEETV